jgi:hypothetical protein
MATTPVPKVKKGDLVRVVLEGEVTYVASGIAYRLYMGENSINPLTQQIVSVEVLTKPVKVGDVITTQEELDKLPGGAVVLDNDQEVFRKNFSTGLWMRAGSSEGKTSGGHGAEVCLPAKLLHLYDCSSE